MFSKNFILHAKGALPPKACELAINFFEKRRDLQYQGEVCDGYYPDMKRCTEICLKREEYTLFESTISKYLKEYTEKYPFIDKLCRWSISPIFNIQRYHPGEGYFYTHCENMGISNSNRVLAWMIYLNDVRDGGYTEFPTQKKKYQPRTGDILIWPAYFTHPHNGIVSKTQKKYIATGWCEYVNI